MQFKSVKLSVEVYQWIWMQAGVSESMDSTLRRIASLPPSGRAPRGRPALPKDAKKNKDSRKKYPVIDMLPGDEIVYPWNRDEHNNARVGGINAAVNRCNRMPGRRYTSHAVSTGLQINRIE